MENIIFSQISQENLQHFSNLHAKMASHRLKPQLSSLKINSFSIILLDMITFEPLQTPIRGINCTHWECIDETSAPFCKGQKCPLCNQHFEEYEKDEYLLEILSKGIFYGVFIHLNTGLYIPISKNNEEILWNMEVLTFLAIKNFENVQKNFSYKNEKIGIDEFMFQISFLDHSKERNLLEIPCRSALCEHLQCVDLKEIWHLKKCFFCGRTIDENSVYIDLLQYGVMLFARVKWSLEEIMGFNFFLYYPEYECFQIGDEFFDFQLKNISISKMNEIIERKENMNDLKQKAEILEKSNNRKSQEKEKNDNEEKIFRNELIFPDPADELMELHYENIDDEILLFEER